MDKLKKYNILRVEGKEISELEDTVVVEYHLSIFLNGKEIVTLPCTPDFLEDLTIGYLHSEGYIKSIAEIENISVNKEKGLANIQTKNLNSKKSIGPRQFKGKLDITSLMDLVARFNRSSKLFKKTGGVHSCGLGGNNDIIIFREDIGRHNAMDKVIGRALVDRIDLEDKILLTSGRVSTEILSKLARTNIGIIVSISATTDLAIEMAKKLDIILIGFARGKKLNIYAGFPSLKI